jgi:hypothetical protein
MKYFICKCQNSKFKSCLLKVDVNIYYYKRLDAKQGDWAYASCVGEKYGSKRTEVSYEDAMLELI